MAATTKWYGSGVLKLAQQTWTVWTTGSTHKGMLVTSSYTPNQDTDDFINDANANELANGNGYTSLGAAFTTKTLTYDSATNETRFDADDMSWTFTASKTFRYLVIYEDTAGAASTDPVIAYIDFGADQTVSGVFTVQFDATGVAKITAS